MRIGPSRCSECGDDYGHTSECSRNSNRPENWPLSKKLNELAKSAAPDRDRLQVLITLCAELARETERHS